MFLIYVSFILIIWADTIYVRVCERRMDLLRAVIIGAAGTPYHDGLFVFDVRFPPRYPAIPPVCVAATIITEFNFFYYCQ